MARKLIALASATGLLCATLATSAVAFPNQAADDTATMKVQLSGLNLRSGPGADRALIRIKNASRAFCGGSQNLLQLAQNAEAQKCKDRMMYLAVTKLDAPLVTASYTRSGAAPAIMLASR
jgi:UrcA family protein